jgi:hypothetical protein
MPNSSRAMNHVKVVLKTKISEISFVSIIKVIVVNDHMFLMHFLFCIISCNDPFVITVKLKSE